MGHGRVHGAAVSPGLAMLLAIALAGPAAAELGVPGFAVTRYATMPGVGGTISLRYQDCNFSDNPGSPTVDILGPPPP